MGSSELKSGLTWRSLLALVYAAALLAPIDVFLSLFMGTAFLTAGPGYLIIAPAVYIVIIMFTEISRMLGQPLTRQEVFIMYNLLGTAMVAVTFTQILYQGYFRSAPLSQILIDPFTKKPLTNVIPQWYAPSPTVFNLRSFFNIEWVIPILIVLSAAALFYISEVGLGLLCAYIFVEVEKLPFPTAPVASEGIITIAERDSTRIRVFTFASVISMVWSTLTMGGPSVLGAALGMRTALVSFMDLSPRLAQYLPGIIFGVTFEPFAYTYGFILSTPAIISILIGSYAVWFLGNPLALMLPSPLFTEFQREYLPSMSMEFTVWRSWLHIWTSFYLGASLGVAVITLIKGRGYLIRSIKSLAQLAAAKAAGYPPLSFILSLWIGGSIGLIALLYFLCPTFPLWVLPISFIGTPFIIAMINARGLGEVGFGVSLPYTRESMILLSGYRGTDIWFTPYYAGGASAASYTYLVKVAKVTETRFMDYFKALFIVIPITWVMSLIVISTLWSMAPIPSEVFPSTTFLWPDRINREVFMMNNFDKIYKPPLIGFGFALTAILTTVSSVIRIPFFSTMGLLIGFSVEPHIANALAIGHLVGNLFFKRKFGKDWWEKYKATALAGIACGFGITAAVVGAVILILKALWHTQATY